MGAAKKWEQNTEETRVPFEVIEGGMLDHEKHGPAEDFFVMQAFDDMKFFFNFLPYHIQNWMIKSDRQLDELEKQKEKTQQDYRYFNFF